MSLIIITLMGLFLPMEQMLKRMPYGSHLRLLAFALPALFSGFLLLQAISEILA
jgi:hypothetical protein